MPVESSRILACCGTMFNVAGLERMSFEVLRVLRERGAQVHCIVNSWENHRIIALAEQIGATWSIGYYRQYLSRYSRDPRFIAKMGTEITRDSFGLVRDTLAFRPTHIFIPEPTIVYRNAPALALLRTLGIKIVMRLANAPAPGKFYERIWRYVINPLIDAYVCNSQFTQRELLAVGIAPEKSRYIYNTAPTRTASATPVGERDPMRIMFVGQIIPEKGLHFLLDALALLVARGIDARLDVVGRIDGWEAAGYVGYHAQIRERANDPVLRERVRFLGERQDVPALLATAAVHCIPSLPKQREAFGVVVVEAKVAGIPSVVTPFGALPELIDQRENGFICADATADALAEGLQYFLSDPARCAKAGEAARKSNARFSHDRFASAWADVFA